MHINVEYFHKSGFATFLQSVKGKAVTVMYDVNTKPYAEWIKELLHKNSLQFHQS